MANCVSMGMDSPRRQSFLARFYLALVAFTYWKWKCFRRYYTFLNTEWACQFPNVKFGKETMEVIQNAPLTMKVIKISPNVQNSSSVIQKIPIQFPKNVPNFSGKSLLDAQFRHSSHFMQLTVAAPCKRSNSESGGTTPAPVKRQILQQINNNIITQRTSASGLVKVSQHNVNACRNSTQKFPAPHSVDENFNIQNLSRTATHEFSSSSKQNHSLAPNEGFTLNTVPVVTIPKPASRNSFTLCEDETVFMLPPLPSVANRFASSTEINQNSSINKAAFVKSVICTSAASNQGLVVLPPLVKFSSPEVAKFKDNINKSITATIVNDASSTLTKKTSKLSLKNRSNRCTPTNSRAQVPSPTASNAHGITTSISTNTSAQVSSPTVVNAQGISTSTFSASEATQEENILSPSHEEILQDILPANYSHQVVSIDAVQPYHKHSDYDQSEMFATTVRINLRSKAEAYQWLEDFKESSFSDWRVRRTFAENTKCLIFKKTFRCTHNTLNQYWNGPASKKHTECDASLTITVKNFAMKRSTDKLLKSHPCEVTLHHCHNHPIRSCDSLRFRKPTAKVEKLFLDMYKNNHSPSSALALHKYDIQVNNPENWFEILADGAACPNLQWCFHLYRTTYKKVYGEPSGKEMVKALFAAVDKYNNECGSKCAASKIFNEDDLIVVICSPLMKRVHQYLKSSGEINFLDSGGSMDRHNTRIFTFLAPSVAGALPLGIIMTSSESEDAVTEGIEMLKSIMPPYAFFGRGPSKGPQVMMTDDSTSERNALKIAFPGIILLLCLFHILSAYWRYVWTTKHQVKPQHKENVYNQFNVWCYSKTETEFKEHYVKMLQDPIIAQNKWLTTHLKGLYARAPEWALCYRSDLIIRGNNTDNYSERTIRSYKDEICQRMKAYSPVQLFDFFTSRLEAYFERRIAAVLNNRKENYSSSKHFFTSSRIKDLQCCESSFDNSFVVKNLEKNTEYFVNMDIEICSCPVGFNGAPCKHQFAVAEQFKLSSTQFLPYEDEEAKATLHKIMTTIPARPGWYATLKSGPTTVMTASTADSSEETATENDCGQDCSEIPDEITPRQEISSGSIPGSESNSGNVDEAIKLWKSINDYIMEGLENKADTFSGAVTKFATTFNKAVALSENAVLSSLHEFSISTFGFKAIHNRRYIRVNHAGIIRRKYASIGRKVAQQGRHPQKSKLGSRNVTQQGRPPKSARTGEHGYAINQRVSSAWDRCNRKRHAAPHNLSQRIRLQVAGIKK